MKFLCTIPNVDSFYKIKHLCDGVVMTNKKIPTPTSDKPDEPQPSAPIGVIKIYMGKGVWNPATGGLVQIDTVLFPDPALGIIAVCTKLRRGGREFTAAGRSVEGGLTDQLVKLIPV